MKEFVHSLPSSLITTNTGADSIMIYCFENLLKYLYDSITFS